MSVLHLNSLLPPIGQTLALTLKEIFTRGLQCAEHHAVECLFLSIILLGSNGYFAHLVGNRLGELCGLAKVTWLLSGEPRLVPLSD